MRHFSSRISTNLRRFSFFGPYRSVPLPFRSFFGDPVPFHWPFRSFWAPPRSALLRTGILPALNRSNTVLFGQRNHPRNDILTVFIPFDFPISRPFDLEWSGQEQYRSNTGPSKRNGQNRFNIGQILVLLVSLRLFWACTVPFLIPFRSFSALTVPFIVPFRSVPCRSIVPKNENRRRLLGSRHSPLRISLFIEFNIS